MAAGETVLLYHIEGDRGRKLKMLFIQNGMKIRPVAKEEYGQPIGALAGIKGVPSEDSVYEGEDFAEEMLVLKGVYGKRLDLLLAGMRKMKVSVPLKAVITEQNLYWDSMKLYEEIRREHEVMTSGSGEN